MALFKRAQLSFEEIIGIYNGNDTSLMDFILSYVYELKNKHPESEGNSNYGGWQRRLEYIGNLLENDHPLKKFIGTEFSEYLKCYSVKQPTSLEFTSLFCNINPPGSSNVMHHHMFGEFSGTLWIQAEQNAGQLIIMNPYPNRLINTSFIPIDKDYNAIHIDPESNKGVFFNSHLVHYVDINRSQKDRVSLGYNLKVHY
jgi:uncharacterized protein (TIGR02466 family)